MWFTELWVYELQKKTFPCKYLPRKTKPFQNIGGCMLLPVSSFLCTIFFTRAPTCQGTLILQCSRQNFSAPTPIFNICFDAYHTITIRDVSLRSSQKQTEIIYQTNAWFQYRSGDWQIHLCCLLKKNRAGG